MKRFMSLVVYVLLVFGLAGVSTAASYADIAYVIDQSVSMSGEFEWLGNSLSQIDTQLQGKGITANYGVAGYESLAGFAYSVNAWIDLTSDISAVVTEVNSVSTYGGTERGYHAADWAANNFSWTGGDYVKVMILITDEDADNASSYAYGGLTGEAALEKMVDDNNILLNVITSQNLYYVWDAAVYEKGAYAGLFDLNYLRTNPVGFTNDFVAAKAEEIIHVTPEPATLLLLGLGFLGLGVLRRR